MKVLKQRSRNNEQSINYINIILEDDRGRNIDINTDWEIVLEFDKIINNNFTIISGINLPDIQDLET